MRAGAGKYKLKPKIKTNEIKYKLKPTKATDSWTNMDISKNKTDHASRDGNSLIISQLHHSSKEVKPKRIKENENREICDKTQ